MSGGVPAVVRHWHALVQGETDQQSGVLDVEGGGGRAFTLRDSLPGGSGFDTLAFYFKYLTIHLTGQGHKSARSRRKTLKTA